MSRGGAAIAVARNQYVAVSYALSDEQLARDRRVLRDHPYGARIIVFYTGWSLW